MNWYYVKQGEQAGPVDDAQLDQLRAGGTVQEDTLVWHEGMANWQPYSSARNAAPATGAPPMPPGAATPTFSSETPDAVCSECANMFPKQNMIRYRDKWVCANCKPVFMQKLAEGAELNAGGMRYAGFWIRFVAKFLDNLIIMMVLGIPLVIIFMFLGVTASRSGSSLFQLESDPSMHAAGAAAGLIGNMLGVFFRVIFFCVNAVYSGFFLGKYGATPGKMACKLIVVDANGAPVTYGRAFGRGFAEMISGLITCNIGYIIAAFDKEKRTLHDHICTTRVIYK